MNAITFATIIKQKAIEATKAADEARAVWRALPKKLDQVTDEKIKAVADMKAAEAVELALWSAAAKAMLGDDAYPLASKLRTVVGLAMQHGAPKDDGGYDIFSTEILQKLASDDDCEMAAIYIRNHWIDLPDSLKYA